MEGARAKITEQWQTIVCSVIHYFKVFTGKANEAGFPKAYSPIAWPQRKIYL